LPGSGYPKIHGEEIVMKKTLITFALVALLALVGLRPDVVRAQGSSSAPAAVTIAPDAVKWNPRVPGIQISALAGDSSKPGPYTVRLKFADGARVAPHWHPEDENVTVVQGTLLAGMGEKYDTASMHEFPTGSFLLMPKEMRHYAAARGETIVQLHGNGPFVINYVNPADDPSKSNK
jgi:anti-sigma factor ChrR (cupin superfamily)